MSDLNYIEKRKLEEFLGMGSGYVGDFSNRTFAEFIIDSTGRNIDDADLYGSGSKANRMRAFWKVEPNFVVGKLISDLVDLYREKLTAGNPSLLDECSKIAARLRQGAPVVEIDVIMTAATKGNFEQLAKAVLDAINRNEPESGLDRLHTFVVSYMRSVCEKHHVAFDRDTALHSLVGMYVKRLKEEGLIESEMSERILKTSISHMEAFNDVRNNKSLAHANAVLNYDESLLIFNNIASAIRFMTAIEEKVEARRQPPPSPVSTDDEVPF